MRTDEGVDVGEEGLSAGIGGGDELRRQERTAAAGTSGGAGIGRRCAAPPETRQKHESPLTSRLHLNPTGFHRFLLAQPDQTRPAEGSRGVFWCL